jgi:proteasome lid subunit RPN8/RPN11
LKFQEIIDNDATRRIGFLSRLANFLEDVFEDAECEDLFYTIKSYSSGEVIVEGVNCKYPLSESLEVFMDHYNVRAEEGAGKEHRTEIYDKIIRTYRETLHYTMKSFAARSVQKHMEYYLGILFNGKGFIIEGEEDRVIVPGGLNQCFAAHTHPSAIPIPSRADIRSITSLFLDRGIGHAIETIGSSIVIYRRSPISEDELEQLNSLLKAKSVDELFRRLSSISSIAVAYI